MVQMIKRRLNTRRAPKPRRKREIAISIRSEPVMGSSPPDVESIVDELVPGELGGVVDGVVVLVVDAVGGTATTGEIQPPHCGRADVQAGVPVSKSTRVAEAGGHHVDRSRLNCAAPRNISLALAKLPMFQFPMDWLNTLAFLNIKAVLVT